MPELHPEQWEKLYISEKVAVLQDCEQRISQHEGRETMDVLAANMAELAQTHPRCRNCDAVFIVDQENPEIVLDDRFLADATVHQAFEKYTHEAAHAYQIYATDHPGYHPNQYEVAEWREARADYDSQGSNSEYRDNALEIDARYFAQSCSKELEQSHEMQLAKAELALELADQSPQQAIEVQERER